MRYVIDTSVIIDLLRGGSIWQKFIGEIDDNSSLMISAVTVFELFSGLSTKDAQVAKKIEHFLKNFEIIGVDYEIGILAGTIFRDIARDLEVPDYIIAASALTVRATVVTLNKKHFEKIPSLSIYSL